MKVTNGYKNDRAAAGFNDVIRQSMKDSFINDLLSANYYSILTDRSTDASTLEQEVIYVLYLSKEGEPIVKFFSIVTTEHVHADGLTECIENAFHWIGIVSLYQRLANLSVDGASVNTGIHNGLEVKMRELAAWLSTIHCFNHSLELAFKDTFNIAFFKEVDNMLLKLFYLYQKSPKHLIELKMFGEMYDQSIPKPYKSYGTRLTAHTVKAMEIVLNNYGIYIKYLESLANTNSQALKGAEIEGEAKKWKNGKFPIHSAIYLDVLTPLKVISLGFQKEKHDPTKAVRRRKEFTWTMATLQLLINASLDGDNGGRLTHLTKLFKEVDKNNTYQELKLVNVEIHKKSVSASYKEIITKLAEKMEDKFKVVSTSPIFENLISVLDVSMWPLENNILSSYCNDEILAVTSHFERLLTQNGCDIFQIPTEWDRLKSYLISILKSRSKFDYLEVWKGIFKNEDVVRKCKNVLHVVEILLITPFTNAKLELVFSRMNRIKTDSRNRLEQERLDTQMCIGKEGISIVEFNPDPYIQKWWEDKVRRINGGKPRNYPSKRGGVASSSGHVVMDIVSVTLSKGKRVKYFFFVLIIHSLTYSQ